MTIQNNFAYIFSIIGRVYWEEHKVALWQNGSVCVRTAPFHPLHRLLPSIASLASVHCIACFRPLHFPGLLGGSAS